MLVKVVAFAKNKDKLECNLDVNPVSDNDIDISFKYFLKNIYGNNYIKYNYRIKSYEVIR